jgi:hypothetical protein
MGPETQLGANNFNSISFRKLFSVTIKICSGSLLMVNRKGLAGRHSGWVFLSED